MVCGWTDYLVSKKGVSLSLKSLLKQSLCVLLQSHGVPQPVATEIKIYILEKMEVERVAGQIFYGNVLTNGGTTAANSPAEQGVVNRDTEIITALIDSVQNAWRTLC